MYTIIINGLTFTVSARELMKIKGPKVFVIR